jgi:hypothetical protein
LPRSDTPSLLSNATTPSLSVSISTPHSNVPSIHDLRTIDSDSQVGSARSEGPSVIITHDVNLLLEYLNRVEGDRQKDAERLHVHMDDIQDQIRDLGVNMGDLLEDHERGGPTPVPLKVTVDRSIQGSVVAASRGAAPHLVPIPLTPPPMRSLSPAPSSLSRSISFLSSHHSDDFSLMESETYPIHELSLSSPSLSEPSYLSSPISSELPEISASDESSGMYLSRSSSASARPQPVARVPALSPQSSSSGESTALPPTPRQIEFPDLRPDLEGLRNLIDDVKNQSSALWDGQLSTNHMLDELRARWPPASDPEILDRLRRLESMLLSLGMRGRDRDADRTSSISLPMPQLPATPHTDLSDSGESLMRRLGDILRDPQGESSIPVFAPTPRDPATEDRLDDILKRRPSDASRVSVEPPPPLVTIDFRQHRRTRARSVSPVLPEAPSRARTAPVVFVDSGYSRIHHLPRERERDRITRPGYKREPGHVPPPVTPAPVQAPAPAPYQPPPTGATTAYPPPTEYTEAPPETYVHPTTGEIPDINFENEVRRLRGERQGRPSGYWDPSRPAPSGHAPGPVIVSCTTESVHCVRYADAFLA